MFGVGTNVGFGFVVHHLDETHLAAGPFELVRTPMTSWHVLFTKATDAIVGYGRRSYQNTGFEWTLWETMSLALRRTANG